MMAEWEVRLPASVAMPRTILRSKPAVSDGARSWAKTMEGGIEAAQFVLDLALEVAQDAARDVEEIPGALAEIVVIELAHLARVGADDLLVGEVDIDKPALEMLLDRFDQRSVFQQKEMRVEDTGVGLADR